MKFHLYRIYHSLGINKRAVIFLIAGIILILFAKAYAQRHFIIPAEQYLARFKASNMNLRRYAVRGAPTYDELITRARYFDESYIKEAEKIRDAVTFPETEREFMIPDDERFAHIKYRQFIDQFKSFLSEELPGVHVYGKFLGVDPLHTPKKELNQHLKQVWLLKVFIQRMQDCGFDSSHISGIVIGEPGSSVMISHLHVFNTMDASRIDVRLSLTLDELFNAFRAFRNKKGHFLVEDAHIQLPEGGRVNKDGKLDVRVNLVYLNLSVRDSINYAPITPSWRSNSDD
ncbi:MAG: hypothetical protein E3K32_05220 [wastewater metagenome]|nr:hypothetical protein [Candidatus Loosdrechtia aerotolerans]